MVRVLRTLLLVLPLTSASLAAQSMDRATVGVRPRAVVADTIGAERSVPWYAPVASLAVPGLGQALLGENRALAYLVVEVYAGLEFAAWRTEGRRRRTEYRRLAADVARSLFSGETPVGPFSYYETMRNFVASGSFDRVPGGEVDPEIDESTFNGSLWRLARETYWSDPAIQPPTESAAYRNAVSLYLRRAVLPEYQWSWRDAALEHDLYKLTIQRSNTAFQRAQDFVGILIANHVLSMVDAIATVRIRYPADPSVSGWGFDASVPWPRAR
jgi:hypothetical protein